MEITAVEPVLLSHVYPEDDQLVMPSGVIESFDVALIRIETDADIIGWGEASHAAIDPRAVRGIVEVFADQIVGRDPNDVAQIREALYNNNLFWARTALPLGVIGAIEVGLYDILGKAREVPVYELLGGAAVEAVPVYGSGGLGPTLEHRVEAARTYAERGFDIVKVRALGEPNETARLVDAIVESTDDVLLAVDAVQGTAGAPWSEKGALQLGRTLDEHADRIYWYEEPCRAENLDGFARVTQALDVRVAGIESATGRYEFRHIADRHAVDVLTTDVTIAGGFAEVRRISGYAAAHDIPLAMHVWGSAVSMLANVHFAATDPNCEIVEYVQMPHPLLHELLPESFTAVGGTVPLPDRPGLGVDIPDDLEKRFEHVPGKGVRYFDDTGRRE